MKFFTIILFTILAVEHGYAQLLSMMDKELGEKFQAELDEWVKLLEEKCNAGVKADKALVFDAFNSCARSTIDDVVKNMIPVWNFTSTNQDN